MKNPDFYLASTEGYDLEEPREGKCLKRLSFEHRDDLMLVRIEPPLIGQRFGLGSQDIDTVIIGTRHKGESLFPIVRWPVYVHVARPLVADVQERSSLRDSEFETIAWAEIYPTLEAARQRTM